MKRINMSQNAGQLRRPLEQIYSPLKKNHLNVFPYIFFIFWEQRHKDSVEYNSIIPASFQKHNQLIN